MNKDQIPPEYQDAFRLCTQLLDVFGKRVSTIVRLILAGKFPEREHLRQQALAAPERFMAEVIRQALFDLDQLTKGGDSNPTP